MIVVGLGTSRKESKKIHSFFNKENGFLFGLESDINNVAWNDSENIIVNRINFLRDSLYKNTNQNKDNFKVIGEVAFYMFPYLELLINNFPSSVNCAFLPPPDCNPRGRHARRRSARSPPVAPPDAGRQPYSTYGREVPPRRRM